MLKLLNTKLLIAILAVLAAIASAAIYQRHETAKAVTVLEQHQRDAEQRRKKMRRFARRLSKTVSATTPPPVTKARLGRAIFRSSYRRDLT